MRWYSVGPTSAASRPMITSTRSSSISVKPRVVRRDSFTLSSPVLEVRAVARLVLRAAAHVHDAFSRFVFLGAYQKPGVALLGDRVGRDAPQVTLLDELLELGRVVAVVGVIIVDRLSQRIQVLLQSR